MLMQFALENARDMVVISVIGHPEGPHNAVNVPRHQYEY
jgi:hypothetical protein